MLKKFVLVAACMLVMAGCAKRSSPIGGTLMSSGGIAFLYDPGWVVKKEEGFWRFEHPSAVAWANVIVSDEQTPTDDLIKIIEGELAKKWDVMNIVTRGDFNIKGRSVCCTRYSLSYYLTLFSGYGIYYGGKDGAIVVIIFVKSGQESVIQKDLANFMNGITFKH